MKWMAQKEKKLDFLGLLQKKLESAQGRVAHLSYLSQKSESVIR